MPSMMLPPQIVAPVEEDVRCAADVLPVPLAGAAEKAAAARNRRAAAQLRQIGATIVAWPDASYLPDALAVDRDHAVDWDDAVAGIAFTLAVTGRATDCTVIASTDIPALDAASCRLVEAHTVAQPAVRHGAPVATPVRIGVRWRRGTAPAPGCARPGGAIPVTSPGMLPWYGFAGLRLRDGTSVTIRLSLSPTGAPDGCAAIGGTATDDVRRRACALAMATMHFLPATDADGRFVRDSVVRHIRFRVR